MKVFWVVAILLCNLVARGQEPSPSNAAEVKPAADIPKDYEMLEESTSPDGRFAILSPGQNDKNEENGSPYPPNLLVRLKPYAVLAKVKTPGLPNGWRDELWVEWSGNDVVAVWKRAKWGIADLSVFEIANDKLKRAHPVFREARKYFDRDFHQRFLKKYPKESDSYIFVSDWKEQTGERDFELKGRKLMLNLNADNKPNLAGGPHWTAELTAIWDLDTAKFEKVDFKPGKIEVRPWLQ
jgi:hypothetical protein